MKPSLVIGAAGQVGEHLVRTLQGRGREVVQADLLPLTPEMIKLDMRQESEVKQVISSIQPGVIYLVAALTNVDYCEQHPEEAYRVNVSGVKSIAEAANRLGARLVFFSSDYVFDGTAGPYAEDAQPNPICEYGRQKLLAEELIMSTCRDHLIIRTTVVYGWEGQGKNFVVRLLRSLETSQTVRVPDDQVGSPTYAPNLADASVELTESDFRGIFHVVGPERVSRYEFAREVARVFGYSADLVQPITTKELKQAAPRPLNAGMTVARAAAVLKTPLVEYRAGLRLMADALRDTKK